MSYPPYAFVGSRTTRQRNARGEGISVFRVHAQHGTLERVQVFGELENPSYLALNRCGDRLYTVHGDGNEVSAFAVERSSGELRLLNRVGCEGRNPVHLALDAAERALIVSNHLSGTVVLVAVESDGSLGQVVHTQKLPGVPGPHRTEQPFSKPHFNPIDPSGKWVVVPDKGLDRIFTFRIAECRLQAAAQPWVDVPEGAGPRNLVFHPVRPWAYVVNELDSTVLACHFDAGNGTLRPFQRLTTLPDTFVGQARAAGIHVDARGRALYVSNRGHDSIAVYAIDGASGRLNAVEIVSSLGRTPRFITLDPDGRWLYALNEDSDTIVPMAVDADTGRLQAAGDSLACGSPVCMVFSR